MGEIITIYFKWNKFLKQYQKCDKNFPRKHTYVGKVFERFYTGILKVLFLIGEIQGDFYILPSQNSTLICTFIKTIELIIKKIIQALLLQEGIWELTPFIPM